MPTRPGPSRGLSLKDVCARLGVRPRQLIDWAEKGVVRPEIADTTGAGRRRLYSEDNLLELLLAREVIEAGFTVRGAARFLRFLRTRPPGFLRTMGAIRLARMQDGRFHVSGVSPHGADHWQRFAGLKRTGLSENHDVLYWVVLDFDAARRRLGM
jgi:DNA-binding transcriptional MerR regulator